MTVLPYPPVFAINTAFGRSLTRSGDLHIPEEEWRRRCLEIIVDSQDKDEAVERLLREIGFSLEGFVTEEGSVIREHIRLCEGLRAKTHEIRSLGWSAWILHHFGQPTLTDDCELLLDRLDAAYRYSLFVSQFANDRRYDFSRHQSDYGDLCQLFYLSDPDMHLLVVDGDLKTRTAGSHQTDRTWHAEGVARLAASPRLALRWSSPGLGTRREDRLPVWRAGHLASGQAEFDYGLRARDRIWLPLRSTRLSSELA